MKLFLSTMVLFIASHTVAQQLEWTALANPDSLQVNAVRFSNDNAKVVSATNCHPAHIRLYHTANGIQTWDYEVPNNLMCQMGIGFSSDGKYLASIEEMGNVIIFDYSVPIPDSINTISMGTMYAFSIDFAPNAQKFAAGGSNGKLQTYQVNSGTIDLDINAHSSWVTAVCYAPNNQWLASGGNDNKIKIWDTLGNLLFSLNGHTDDITSLKFSPDNTRLFSSSLDNTVKVWNTTNGTLIQTVAVSNADVNAMDLTSNGLVMATVSKDNLIRLFTTSTFTPIDSFLQHHNGIPICLGFSSDGSKLVTGTSNGLVTLYNVASLTNVDTYQKLDFNDVTIYPNPIGNDIYISSKASMQWYKISDVLGEVLFSGNIINNRIPVDKNLKSGTYVLTLNNHANQQISRIILKNK
nr:T9SS type A sorting domain-containing protein [Chitinophagaceae bacterium]